MLVMHICRTVPLLPHSYQEVVTDRMEDQMNLLAKLIGEGS